ncbi:hypothetical protein GQ55_6G161300 [Panicum hallii var. hallii]|uniref:Uncharacterized protein n=1 Tax=Panicum hallii var. hallii TaxID=1504633 RepID=A0A2T7D6G9_9POAL|nr:hypothetical protein GQ55_6G161300 [Panicum hallii var. hallii]
MPRASAVSKSLMGLVTAPHPQQGYACYGWEIYTGLQDSLYFRNSDRNHHAKEALLKTDYSKIGVSQSRQQLRVSILLELSITPVYYCGG